MGRIDRCGIKMKEELTPSRLYGIYIHNLTTMTDREVALDAVNRLLHEKPPMRYEYGDVLVLLPDNEIGDIVETICHKNGFITERIAPNQLYRLLDSMVVHYVYVDVSKSPSPKEVDNFILDWEVSMRLTEQDQRKTRILRTFFMKT